MKKTILTTALLLIAAPVYAKEVIVKEISDDNTGRAYFSPDKLTVQPGDTVTFENVQDSPHEVMFVNVPKQVDEMIMSPMQNNKGEKFSYTFTVPGTYQFHCHPHEAAGMKGTLIVGTPSKAGETKPMDHHKMAKKLEDSESVDSAITNNAPQGTGKIIEVDAEKHTVKMKHDPVKVLGWPAMTMTFKADNSVDLSGIQSGDTVSFTLKAEGKDNYIISNLKKD